MTKTNFGASYSNPTFGGNNFGGDLIALENPELGVLEIANNTTIEVKKADYFDTNALREPNYRLCQLNSKGQRYYYILGEKGIELFPSVTTILKKCAPENTILNNWRFSLGKENADAYTMERAYYGTFVHGLLQELIITRKFDLDGVREKLAKYIERERLPYSFMDYEDDVKEDLIAFAKWVKEYDVRPYAVEVAIYHPELKYAGLVDCACSMYLYPHEEGKKAKSDERIDALVDFKTTRKDFQDDHAMQLEMYRLAWNEVFPDKPIYHIANVRPKDWTSTAKKNPSYGFEWQTDNPVIKRVSHIIELYKLMEAETRKVTLLGGQLDIDEKPFEENYKTYTLEELIEENNSRLEEKEEVTPTENNCLF